MKQLLFLLLFPCFALAQYQGNAGQKITLGEQTSADGLVYRGITSDTSNLMTNKLDTSAYLVLDTITEAIWLYRASTTPKWNRVVDSLNNLQGQLSLTTKVTGVLPVGNGGTNTSTAFTVGSVVFAGASGTYSQDNSNLFWDNTNKRLGIGTTSPSEKLDLQGTMNMNGTLGTYLQVQYNGANRGYLGTANGTILGGATTDLGISATSNLVFGTSGSFTEQMRITSGGNVGIGTVSPQSGYRLHVVDSVYVGGNVSASAYTTRSDYDLKDEIQNISYGINEVMQMQPVKYTYKSNGSTQLGFIAQDLGVITPEVVSFEDKMSVYYNALIPILTKAIQEQQALIKALEQRILTLENK